MQKVKGVELIDDKKGVNPVVKVDRHRVYLSRLKRRILKHVWIVRSVILVFVISLLFLGALVAKRSLEKSKYSIYFTLAQDFLYTPKDKVVSVSGVTNILILGKGGKGHEAPDLTDTMMVVSLDRVNNKIRLLSLPRDIWIADMRAKLNSVYYWGNQKKEGGGKALAKAVTEDIIGQPIQYSVVVDFSGFKRIIDVLGGVEVKVEREFTDEKYPIVGRENDTCGGDTEVKCRYETIHFSAGIQYMDGETALKFARSRNAQGDEGSDFARAARQQKIIEAIKDKILSRQVLLSPQKLLTLKDAVLSSLETDIDPETAAILARYFYDARKNLESNVLPEDLLVNPPYSKEYDNLYVFVPASGNWDKVHEWVSNYFKN